jgi:ABC-type arginine transport system ATPase subunit
MDTPQVNINFKVLSSVFKKYIRDKAKKSGSTIVYIEKGQLIEENPNTLVKRILKEYNPF